MNCALSGNAAKHKLAARANAAGPREAVFLRRNVRVLPCTEYFEKSLRSARRRSCPSAPRSARLAAGVFPWPRRMYLAEDFRDD